MCSNPLVLAMYVARDQSGESASSPDTRTRFYEQVTEELLIARRSRQLGMAAKTALLQQRESLLGQLAFENLLDQEQAANQISFRRAIALTRQICGAETVETASDILRDICKETGILTEERIGETLCFIHLTFCEFLAAREAVEGRSHGLDELIHAHKSFSNSMAPHIRTRLVEAIPFALGLAPRVQRKAALLRVHEIGDASVSGRCFLETQAYDHPSWAGYVESEVASLVQTHPDEWSEMWLRRLHLMTVVVTDEGEWAHLHNQKPSFPLQTLFVKLIRGHRERLEAIFDSYAAFDPQSALRLAAAYNIDFIREHPGIVVAHLSDPPFYSAIMERIRRASPKEHDSLVMLLAEGALSSAYIAHRLASEPPDVIPGSVPAKSVPRPHRWFLPVAKSYSPIDGGMLRLSLLTYTLSLATQKISPYAYALFPRISIIRLVPPPASLFFLHLMRLNAGFRSLFGICIFGLISFVLSATNVTALWAGVIAVISAGIVVNVAQWAKMSCRYYVAMLLHSDSLITNRMVTDWLAPGVLLAHLTMSDKTLAMDRIVSLRHLRLTHGNNLGRPESDESLAELRTISSGVEGRTHRL
jgi:hypothetical protein